MAEYTGQTDQENEVKLPSGIQSVVWTSKIAAPDTKVGLEVYTQFIGHNSELEIKLKDSSGKSFGIIKDKISGNKFWCNIQVPADAEQILYANVKLSKHGLEMKSNPLVIRPIKIENVKWDKEEARRGDILKLTADIKKVPDGTEAEIEIWEHDADQAHDLISKFPVIVISNKVEAEWEFEYHEDTDDIPTAEEVEQGYNPPEYFFRVKVGEIFSDSELLEFKDWIEIELRDHANNPISNAEYILQLPDDSERRGNLNEEGTSIEENIPPGRTIIRFPEYSIERTSGEDNSE